MIVEDKYDIELKYSKSSKLSFNLATLTELRDRAQLIVHTGNSIYKNTEDIKNDDYEIDSI